jgi:peroxiredoxin Q/BCP
MIEQGQAAPDFTLPDQDGDPVDLSELRGQPVVLYFYPKADTPGCTTQACGVRDHRADYAKAGAVVLGISPDPISKVKKFHEKHSLGFALLADEDHAVAEIYGFGSLRACTGAPILATSAPRSSLIVMEGSWRFCARSSRVSTTSWC